MSLIKKIDNDTRFYILGAAFIVLLLFNISTCSTSRTATKKSEATKDRLDSMEVHLEKRMLSVESQISTARIDSLVNSKLSSEERFRSELKKIQSLQQQTINKVNK